MNLSFKQSALADLEEARDFYEGQESGAGDYFLDRMEEEFAVLHQTAGIHRQREGFHCFITKRFHHLIYYRVENNVPVIYAVIDGRRDPASNQERLKRL